VPEQETAKVALVTGASRGIGKASALALASAGFDVAITARTVHEGDARSEPNSVRGDDPVVSLPGSLESTAAEIASHGRRALIVPMDLLDVASVEAAPVAVLAEWGRVDVMFNNAIYQGRGSGDRILDMRLDDIDNVMRGNFAHQLRLIQLVVPHMIEQGAGRILNMVSGSARHDPPGPAGAGGWGIGYSASKAAFGRIAGGIEAEFKARGVRAFNVDPGNVITEKRRLLRPDDDYENGFGSAPAQATCAVVAWLAATDEALRYAGKWVYAPKLCADLGLLPGWPPDGVTP
jgi:NAD(P)-dependent dehydrogenase (short-subunit alcohol dehydrogenase family)